MHIYLTRHGEDLNTTPGYLSDVDVALSGTGEQQATSCAHKLQHALAPDSRIQIITSPKQRTIQTARSISELLASRVTSIKVDERLTERDCAAYVGRAVSEVFSLSEAELIEGGMEPYADVHKRLGAFYKEISDADVSTVIVTHSGNVRPLTQISQGLPGDPSARIQEFSADEFIQLQ